MCRSTRTMRFAELPEEVLLLILKYSHASIFIPHSGGSLQRTWPISLFKYAVTSANFRTPSQNHHLYRLANCDAVWKALYLNKHYKTISHPRHLHLIVLQIFFRSGDLIVHHASQWKTCYRCNLGRIQNGEAMQDHVFDAALFFHHH